MTSGKTDPKEHIFCQQAQQESPQKNLGHFQDNEHLYRGQQGGH